MGAVRIQTFLSWSRQWLRKPSRFVDSWWLPLGLGGSIAALLVFILLFIEPMGTDRYEASYRSLRLSGYGLCVLLPFLIVHGLSRWWVERNQAVWRIWHEMLALALLIALVFNVSYLYNALIVNEIGLDPLQWFGFITWVTLPYVPLLVPPALLIRRALIAALGDRTGEERIVLQGRNQDDRLRLAASDFVYAEAEQNYVTVNYLNRGAPSTPWVFATRFRPTWPETTVVQASRGSGS
ncbi:MAG: hypothetical protein AAGH65_11885 [Pseudomonadota bacterium]